MVVYLVLGLGAAVENVIPPVPADTFVLVGAFLTAGGMVDPWLVFLATWLANVGSALGVYGLAWHYGEAFFEKPIGHWLLRPHQMRRIEGFYGRWGVPAIFGSRFLPGFRAVVPVFAGVTKVAFWRVALPLTTASAIWYGALVFLGAATARNIGAIFGLFDRVSTALLLVAGVLIAVLVVWWWRTRTTGL